MHCPNCQSDAVSVIPAEVRLYRNILRTLSHPPMTPSPDIRVCLDCGWSEFSIPSSWLAAGWLRSLRPEIKSDEAPARSGIAVVRNDTELVHAGVAVSAA